jgi:hypothetical protein
LGINPGGSPSQTSIDGTKDESGSLASASASYFERGEHDLLDCNYRENAGLRALLLPLVGNDPARLRREAVRTNMAFRRTASVKELDRSRAYAEAKPYLLRIIHRVAPTVVLLTGVPIETFNSLYASRTQVVSPEERDPGVKQVVFSAVRSAIPGIQHPVLVIQVAHASQFSWTYAKYRVSERVLELANAGR